GRFGSRAPVAGTAVLIAADVAVLTRFGARLRTRLGPGLRSRVRPGLLPLAVAVANDAGSLVAARLGGFLQLVGFFLVFEFQEVGYIEEGVALQPEVHKGGLHAGKDARDTPVIDRSSEGVLVFALVIDFGELVVFKNSQPRLMRCAGNAYLFCHRTFPPGGGGRP